MDHAHDMAYKLRRGLYGDTFNAGDHISIQRGDGERQEFVVRVSDGSVFRVTVEAIGYDGLREDEVELPETRVPNRTRAQDEFIVADGIAAEQLVPLRDRPNTSTGAPLSGPPCTFG